MKIFGIAEKAFDKLIELIKQNSNIEKVVLFGSRAMGKYEEGSDIDLALFGEHLKLKDQLNLSSKLEQLDWPYTFDFQIYNNIKDQDVLKHVDRVGIVLYQKLLNYNGDWKETQLEGFIDVQNGYAFKSYDFNDSSGIPVIKIKNVASGKLDLTDVQYYDGLISDKENFIIKKDDILIAMTGSHLHQPSSMVGRVVRYDLEQIALLNQRVGKIYSLDKDILNEDFIYQFYRKDDVTYELALNAGGSANQANISPSLIKSITFSKPPLPEQKAIAGVLSSLDDKIDLLHRQNKTLETMAETLFRQWFVKEADESWDEKKLEEIVDIGIGRTPPRKEFNWFTTNPSDVKWVSIKDMGESGIYILSTAELLTIAAVYKFNIPLIPKNTVLLSFKMTVGRVAITTEEMLSNEAIAHFKFNSTTPITKEYLYLFLKSFRYELLGSTSSIVTSINSEMIKNMEILIPDRIKMDKFQQQTELYFNKILINQKQIRTLEKLRDTLLPKLMSGEIRIKI